MKTKTHVAVATFDAMRKWIPGADAFTTAFISTLDDYLKIFACPSDAQAEKTRYPCLKCGELYAGFHWGIQHGTGSCSKCGWPARAYHFVTDETGTEVRISMVLQYHPDGVVRKRRKK